MDIGIVIPVHADAQALERLLRAISGWDDRSTEIVVVSSAADPAMLTLCERHGAKLVAGPENRGAQLDIGARASGADILWFLHASATPDPDSLTAIAGAVAAGAESGCFRFTFAGAPKPIKRTIAALTNVRVQLGGIPYGDQGLFARSDVYAACGGFPHVPLFEEVELVHQLRRRGSFRILQLGLGASPRRFERDGWLRRSVLNRWLALCYMVGVPAERLASGYRKTVESQP